MKFCLKTFIFLTSISPCFCFGQESFNSTPIDQWAEVLVSEINAQIDNDNRILAAQNLAGKYNRFAASNKYAPVLKLNNEDAQQAYDRRINRNDGCFGGVIEERLKFAILKNCNLETVQHSCEVNESLYHSFLNKYQNAKNSAINLQNTSDALSIAKRTRRNMIKDLKKLISANRSCNEQIKAFRHNNLCANTYTEVIEPIRGLIRSTCTENAVRTQISKFKNTMSDGMGSGYADQFYHLGEIHIQSRKAEIQLAKYLISINNLILGLERGSKAPVDSPRPQMRETSSLCDPARKTCQGASGG